MSYRTHCDWCGSHLAYEDDQAVMPVTIYHRRGKGALDAKWAEEVTVTRHFCARPKASGDAPVDQRERCYDKAIAAIKGTVVSDPGLGMEWRIVPIDEGGPAPAPRLARAVGVPAPPTTDPSKIVAFKGAYVTRELHEVMVQRLPAKRRGVLPGAGIQSLDQVAAMTDEQLLAIDGIGKGTLARLREAVLARDPDDGATLARKVYELLQAGLPHLGDEDPMRSVLAGALPSLAAALGEPA
ncbi:MAG: hypothetical protein QOJ46_620 [bacterium]|jgi:hypothetical protein